MFVRKGRPIDWGMTLLGWGLCLAAIKLALMGLVRVAIVGGIIVATIGGVVLIYNFVSWAVSANRRRLPAPQPVAMLPPPN